METYLPSPSTSIQLQAGLSFKEPDWEFERTGEKTKRLETVPEKKNQFLQEM